MLEPSSSNVVNPVAPEAVVETLPSEVGDLNDLLGKIKTAVGQGLAGAEVGDSTDPFAGIFQKISPKCSWIKVARCWKD